MAPPTLTWDAPADGGSPIAGYRVLLFEGETLVDTLTSTGPTIAVSHGAVVRTAYVQALNDAGYSAPLQVAIPSGIQQEHQPFVASGGGALTFTATSGATPAPTFAAPQIAAARSGGDIVFTQISPGAGYIALSLLRAGSQIANPITLPMNVADTFTSDRVWSVRARGADGKVALSNEVTVPAYVLPPDPSTGPAAKPSLSITRASDGGLDFTSDVSAGLENHLYAVTSGSQQSPYDDNIAFPYHQGPNDYTKASAASTYPVWRLAVRGGDGVLVYSDDALTPTTPTPAPNSHLIQDAVLLGADGVSTWETTGKSATDNERGAFAALLPNANNQVTWFKFHLDADVAKLSLTTWPLGSGYQGQNSPIPGDTRIMVFSATRGDLTDATIPGNLTLRYQDDDGAGNGALSALYDLSYTAGWWYVAVGYYSAATPGPLSDQRLAIKGLSA